MLDFQDYEQEAPPRRNEALGLLKQIFRLLGIGQQEEENPSYGLSQRPAPNDYFQQQLRDNQLQEQPNPYGRFGQNSTYMGSNKNDILMQAKEAIEKAYPNNPVMRKVALTQAILESGLTGKPSKLATESHNLFGIKSSRSAPGTAQNVNYNTAEFGPGGQYRENAGFSSNRSFEDSARQYARLLRNKRYSNVLAAENPLSAFQALQNAGYATDPNYARKLSSIYNKTVRSLF